jgi:hypothetical protein
MLEIVESRLIIEDDCYAIGEGSLIDDFPDNWTDEMVDEHLQQYDGKPVYIINGITVVSEFGIYLGTYYN